MTERRTRLLLSRSERTHFAKQRMRKVSRQITSCQIDGAFEERRKRLLCRSCYYLRNEVIAGQGFTDYVCDMCEQIVRWPNTDTPPICGECAAKHGLCIRCGGAREWDNEEAPVRPGTQSKPRDANGYRVRKNIHRALRRELEGGLTIEEMDNAWSVNVWEEPEDGFVSEVRRYVYRTKRQAKEGKITDAIGENGRIGGREPWE